MDNLRELIFEVIFDGVENEEVTDQITDTIMDLIKPKELVWVDMSIMEPTWYRAITPIGNLELNMNWDETEWTLLRSGWEMCDDKSSDEFTDAFIISTIKCAGPYPDFAKVNDVVYSMFYDMMGVG